MSTHPPVVEAQARKAWKQSRSAFKLAAMDYGDVLAAGLEGYFLANRTHEPERSPLEAWQSILTRQAIYRELNRALGSAGRATLREHEAFALTHLPVPEDVPTDDDEEQHAPYVLEAEYDHIRTLVLDRASDDDDVSLLFLYYWGGFTMPELAERSGRSWSQVQRDLKRARKKLSEEMSNQSE